MKKYFLISALTLITLGGCKNFDESKEPQKNDELRSQDDQSKDSVDTKSATKQNDLPKK